MKKRICIYPKDVAIITGKTERHGRSLLKAIRTHLNKQKHQAISIKEFSEYMGLDQEEVRQVMM